MVRTLVDFDFRAQPRVNPEQVRAGEAGRWIAHDENLFRRGPTGSVRPTWRSAWVSRHRPQRPVHHLGEPEGVVVLQAHDTDTWDTWLNRYVKPQLLIIV